MIDRIVFVGFPPQHSHWVRKIFPPTHSLIFLIFQFFLSVPPGARRLSTSTIFRFSSAVSRQGFGGFSSIDLPVFLHHFPPGFWRVFTDSGGWSVPIIYSSHSYNYLHARRSSRPRGEAIVMTWARDLSRDAPYSLHPSHSTMRPHS